MLLDTFIPKYDFTEVHSIRVKAPAEVVFRAAQDITMSEISGIVRLLVCLRALPEKMVGRKYATKAAPHEPMLSDLYKSGFTKLAETAPSEIVFGLIVPGTIGRVWKKSSSLEVTAANSAEFLGFKDPGYLHVVANFLVEDDVKAGYATLRTESRIRALSRQALRDFTPYWRIIRPFSGLIRRLWLNGIRRRAEQALQGI